MAPGNLHSEFSKAATRSRSEKGSAPLFFATFVLPFLFFLLSLSLDVGAYYSEQASTQKILDDTATYAYRFLPYAARAESAAEQYLARYGSVADGVAVSVVSDSIHLRATRVFPLFFSRLFGAEDVGIPLDVTSRVRGGAFDAFITFDTASYMAPAVSGTQGWGAPSEWPASGHFDNPVFQPQQNPPDERVLTQQCFNPAISAVKAAAIATSDYLSSFSLNRVGIGLDSGNSIQPLEVIRPVRSLAPIPQSDTHNQEAQFLDAANLWVRSIDCAAVAERFDSPSAYQFPNRSVHLPSRGDFSGRPLSMVVPNQRELDPAILPFLQSREVAWSQVARTPQPGATAQLLNLAFSEVLTAPSMPSRGGLVDRVTKLVVIFAGELPREGGAVFPQPAVSIAMRNAFRETFIRYVTDSQERGRVVLLYVLLQHEGISNRATEMPSLQQLFDSEIQAAGLEPERLRARVIYASNADELTQELMQALVLLNKTAVISL